MTRARLGQLPGLAAAGKLSQNRRPGTVIKDPMQSPMRRKQQGSPLALLACLLGLTGHAYAAGGHHAVEDAALLEPGQCQVEFWHDRQS